jgi:adenylate cyclase
MRAAVATQAELTGRNEALAEARRMHFRIGVNLGDIHELEDGTVYGDGVNIATRLESLAERGGIMLSEDAWRQVRRNPDLAFADAGPHDVKNVADPVQAYRVETDPTNATPAPGPIVDRPSIMVLIKPYRRYELLQKVRATLDGGRP